MTPIEVQVLILTSELDFATDLVCRKLASMDVPFLRLNREKLDAADLVLDPVAPTLLCSHGGSQWHVGPALRSVWWRQGTFDRNVAGADPSTAVQLHRSQWSAFMRSMMVFDHATWVNHPGRIYRAETKAVQLREAAAIGFDVPPTVMTNSPEAEAARAIGTSVALKSVDTLLLRDGQDQLFGYTSIVDWAEVASPELRFAPATVQAALHDKVDLRVTIVGNDMWAVAIRRDGRGIDGDWRLTPKQDVQISPHPLDAATAARCFELLRRLDLGYGAIDLAVSAGRTWFVEINPTGEWGWLEHPDRPIADAIAKRLASPC